MLLPETKKEEAKKLVKRIKERAEKINPPVFFSWGVVENSGEKDVLNVINKADKKMRKRKERGRGRRN